MLPSGYHFGSVPSSSSVVDDGVVVGDTGNDNEPLLRENKDRFVLFPIEHNDILGVL